MKALALVVGTFLALGMVVAPALAQAPAGSSGESSTQTPQASAPAQGSEQASKDVDVKAENRSTQSSPGSDARPGLGVSIDKKDETTVKNERRDDSGAALPRGAASDRTAIFGLSPTAAVIVGAALLVVVILAIVAMTRSGETTYIDRERRY
ncbi:MAG: hypothetical protein HYU51_19920 [Candidatus Rokubacteria bacterium]|nr:hypothetical protein [Candidatus Rokubacteria bacterium]